MPKASVSPPAAIDPALVDTVFDRYLDWKDASSEVWETYARWRAAVSGDGTRAFADYIVALAVEENAGGANAELVAAATEAGDTDGRRRRYGPSGGRGRRAA